MRQLILGGGGREGIMAWALEQEKRNTVFCAPGNAGIEEQHATSVRLDPTDATSIIRFVKKKKIDLTIVGPEAPLVAGVADRLRKEGLLICGPGKAGARAEGSKAWFKRFLRRHGLPTATFRVFKSPERALEYIRSRGPENIVIKADGLMGGKGVLLPETLEEASQALLMLKGQGKPGREIVIEDRLFGFERSVMGITDGVTAHTFPFTMDHKRVGEGDTGPNTGGMGALTLSLPRSERLELEALLKKVVAALASEGISYRGFIYLGVMMTADGPMVLECNVRLGDPEAQAILPSLEGDFAELCMAAARGELHTCAPLKQVCHAFCIVLTSAEYPERSERDDFIYGIKLARRTGALVIHAGTGKRHGRFTTNKAGRVLNVIGRGDTIHEAQALAYHAASFIEFPGVKYRRDLGHRLFEIV